MTAPVITEPNRAFKFTATSLKKTTAAFDASGATGIILRDSEMRGLICKKQKRDWMIALERKVRGKIWRASLEQYHPATFNVASARQSVQGILGEIASGTYLPASKKVDAEGMAGKLTRMTVADALALHCEVNPQLRAGTRTSYTYAIDRLTDGKARLIRDIDSRYIRAAYDRLCVSHSPATANLALRSFRAIWNTWADEHPEGQEPGRNPTKKITTKRGRMVKVAPREGALSPEQRRPWFDTAKAGADRLGPTGGAYRALEFLFLTGLRRTEALGLRWDEIDGNSLTISARRMKAGVALSRPITSEMRVILNRQAGYHGTTGWVFPARVGAGHLGDPRKTLRQINADALGDPAAITQHDLRRGYIATGTLAGIPEVAIKLLVGHTTSDITQVYARAIRFELPRLAEQIEGALLS